MKGGLNTVRVLNTPVTATTSIRHNNTLYLGIGASWFVYAINGDISIIQTCAWNVPSAHDHLSDFLHGSIALDRALGACLYHLESHSV